MDASADTFLIDIVPGLVEHGQWASVSGLGGDDDFAIEVCAFFVFIHAHRISKTSLGHSNQTRNLGLLAPIKAPERNALDKATELPEDAAFQTCSLKEAIIQNLTTKGGLSKRESFHGLSNP